MEDKAMLTLGARLGDAVDALLKAQHYFTVKNAYECENWVWNCNEHLKKILPLTTGWSDEVEESERVSKIDNTKEENK